MCVSGSRLIVFFFPPSVVLLVSEASSFVKAQHLLSCGFAESGLQLGADGTYHIGKFLFFVRQDGNINQGPFILQ